MQNKYDLEEKVIKKLSIIQNVYNKIITYINAHKFLKYVLLLLLLVILFVYFLYGYSFKNIYLHHDAVMPLLMADDILKGNFLLKDWFATTRPFIFEIYLFYLIPFSIFRFSIYMEAYYPAFVMLLLVISIYFVSVYNNRDKSSLFLFLMLIVIFPIPNNVLTRLGYSFETYVAVFFALYLIGYIITHNIVKLRYYVLLLILSFAVSTYNLQHYAFIMPMFLVLIYRYMILNRNKIEIYTALTMLGGLLLNKILYFIVSLMGGGISYGGGYVLPRFTTYNDIPDRIFKKYINDILNLTNSMPFGKTFIEGIPYAAGIILLCFGYYLVYKVIRNFNKHDIINQFLAVQVILWTLIIVFSNFILGHYYYYCLILNLIILIIRCNIFDILKNYFVSNKLYYRYSVFIVICILSIIGYKNIVDLRPFDVKKFYNNELAQIIKDNKLGYGYTNYVPYGLLPTIFLDTDYLGNSGDSGVLGLLNDNLNMSIHWSDKSTWYEKPAHYLVADNSRAPINKYIEVYGKPDKIVSTSDGKAHVLIYEKDLSEYLITNSFKTVIRCNNNSELHDNILTINPKSQCDGPFISGYWFQSDYGIKSRYLRQNPGKYIFTITGNNLDKLKIETGDRNLKTNEFKQLEMFNVKKNSSEISFEMDIEKRIDNLEFILTNQSDEQVFLYDFKKKRID